MGELGNIGKTYPVFEEKWKLARLKAPWSKPYLAKSCPEPVARTSIVRASCG